MRRNPVAILSWLADEVKRGGLSRRGFLRAASWIGAGAAGMLALGVPRSGGAVYPMTTTGGGDAEIDRLLKELGEAVNEYNRKVDEMEDFEDDEVMNDQGDEDVYLRLAHPAGRSPKVFQRGWLFGAECLIRPEDEDGEPADRSGDVEWSGSGSFNPTRGASCRPSFQAPGANKIVLSIQHKGRTITRTIQLEAVDPERYAAQGMKALCMADSHGCPICPHTVTGPIEVGSPQVLIDGRPAARLGDRGTHASCCGPNSFTIAEGDPEVLINGRPAAFIGAKTIHCGGMGTIIG